MDDKATKILKAFRIIYDYKEQARDANASATETLKSLVAELNPADPKTLTKELREGLRAWIKETEGDTSVSEGLKIVGDITS